ncbi:MAG: PP2C family protein-serine/threonine phosphatase [bacterium]
MRRFRLLSFFIIVSALASVVILQLYPKIQPLSSIRQVFDRKKIAANARQMLHDLNLHTDDLKLRMTFHVNETLMRQAQNKFGVERSNQLIRERLPVYYWQMEWSGTEKTNSSRSQQAPVTPLAWRPGDVSIKMNLWGHLLAFDAQHSDSLNLPTVPKTVANQLANDFIAKYSAFKNLQLDTLVETTSHKEEKVTLNVQIPPQPPPAAESHPAGATSRDYQFSYSTLDSDLENKVKVTVNVNKDKISSFQVHYQLPDEIALSANDAIPTVIEGVMILAFIFLFILIGIKRFRAYEIGYQMAIFMAIIAALSYGIEISMITQTDMGWEIFFTLIFGPIFIGFALWIIWVVSESVGREVWKEKFISLDLLRNGHFLHSKIAENILRGISLGLLFLTAWLGLTFLTEKMFSLHVLPFEENNFLMGKHPALYILNKGITHNIFRAAVFLLFAGSLLKRRFSSGAWVLVVPAIIWGLSAQGHIEPWSVELLIDSLIGLLIMGSFLRYDFLTTFIALFTFKVWNSAAALFYMQSPEMLSSGKLIVFSMLAVVVYALVALFTKDHIRDFDTISPVFVRHITERQRLQGELAVAREVQMSFLPAQNPQMPGLEIASKCLPANEVGGDYFDFLTLGKNKLGVVVGDVSGKGTQAAFYMTLTKGFLKALAASFPSPAQLLIKINNLFYENVERGPFISMIYGLFDADAKTLTMARAGHNPLIIKRHQSQQAEYLNAAGIALGLEKGKIFAQSIKEQVVPFNSGDLFVFYTDGFTEAMNKNKEEFGEQRLLEKMPENSCGSAQEHLELMFAHVRKFMARAPQQDDMTMVLVKIT